MPEAIGSHEPSCARSCPLHILFDVALKFYAQDQSLNTTQLDEVARPVERGRTILGLILARTGDCDGVQDGVCPNTNLF